MSGDVGMIAQQACGDVVEFLFFADVDRDGGSVDESVGVLVSDCYRFSERGGRGGKLTLGGFRCGW